MDDLGGHPFQRRAPLLRWQRHPASELACASKTMGGWFDSLDFPPEEDDPAREPEVPRGTEAVQLALDNFNAAHPPGRIIVHGQTLNELVQLRFNPVLEPLASTGYRSTCDLMGRDVQDIFQLRRVWDAVVPDDEVRAHLERLYFHPLDLPPPYAGAQ